MPVFLILGGLICLWIAARVGYRQRMKAWEKNPIYPKPDPMRPGLPEVGATMLVIGIILCGFAVVTLLSDEYRPSTGRWSWLWNSLYSQFGATGVAVAQLSFGAGLVAAGIKALRCT